MMSIFTKCLMCALGPRPCFLWCFRKVKESTTTRLMYTLMLLTVAVLSTISHEGGPLEHLYSKYSYELDVICKHIHGGERCARLSGFIGIYRISLPLFFFHITMTLLTIGVSSSQTVRGKLHNGFWMWKVSILVTLYLLAYYFRIFERYITVWMILGIAGGLIFIYVQHVTLIDFAYEINGIWRIRWNRTTRFAVCLYLSTLAFYLLTIAIYAFLAYWYGLPYRCSLNLTVIGINSGLTALFAVCSFFSTTLRRRQLWLPGAVTSAFVAFLTWTALSSQPKTISSHDPWRKPNDRTRNVSLDQLIIVAHQLDRLLSDRPTSTGGSRQSTSQMSNLQPNPCLPGNVITLSEHVGQDITMFIGLIVVIGGSLYSSFKTTLQARRLGIRTRREKLKRLLFPIPEHPEPTEQAATMKMKESDSVLPLVGEDSGGDVPEYLTAGEVKREERALNMLAAAVADLPNPKVFRRPSVRQPRQPPNPMPLPSQTVDSKRKQMGQRPEEKPSKPSVPASAQRADVKSNLSVSSSVPDLTATMRQLAKQQRTNLLAYPWYEKSQSHLTDTHKSPGDRKRSSNCQSDEKSNSRRESIKEFGLRLDPQLEHVISQLHSHETKTPKKRVDTKRIPTRPVARGFLNPIADENAELELSAWPSDNVHGKISSNGLVTNCRSPSSPWDNRHAPLYANRSPVAPCATNSPYSVWLGSTENDVISPFSPKHLRYELARSASDLVLGRRMSRLIESQPELAAPFAFLGPMLNTSAPRDQYIVYNECIAPVYSYPWFHFIYALATLYLMTQLTNWYNPQISRVETLSGSWANMWMKLTSSWIALILYAWTIVCPRFCAGRKLGDTPFVPRTPRPTGSPTTPV